MQHVFCRRITDPCSPWSDLRQLAAFWQKSGCTISVCTYPNQPRPALFNVLTSSTYYLPIQSWQETPMEQCYIPPEWGLHVVNFCLEAKRGSFRSFRNFNVWAWDISMNSFVSCKALKDGFPMAAFHSMALWYSWPKQPPGTSKMWTVNIFQGTSVVLPLKDKQSSIWAWSWLTTNNCKAYTSMLMEWKSLPRCRFHTLNTVSTLPWTSHPIAPYLQRIVDHQHWSRNLALKCVPESRVFPHYVGYVCPYQTQAMVILS